MENELQGRETGTEIVLPDPNDPEAVLEWGRTHRKCSHCKQMRHIDNFYEAKDRSRGYTSRCKDCRVIHRNENKDRINKWTRENRLKKHFGIPPEVLHHLLEWQKYRCLICGKKGEYGSNDLVIDHDHTTGEIRGIICSKCNLILGNCNESPEILLHAIQYLLTWKISKLREKEENG